MTENNSRVYTFILDSITHMSNLLLVDFDGTIFNSDLFHQDIKEFLFNTYRTSFDDFDSSYDMAKADGKPHSLKKQLNILKLKNVNGLIKEIKNHLITLNKNYLYPESEDFISNKRKDIIIFTYAQKDYYQYKLSICGLSRKKIPYVVVDSNKKEFLEKNQDNIVKKAKREHCSQFIWIDDKIDGFGQQIPNTLFIRIKRAGDKYGHLQTPLLAKEIYNLLEV